MTSGPHVATPSSHCHHGDHSCMDFNQFPLGVTDLVLPLHVLRNSRFLLWAFSDRAWDSYISSPGGTVQKLRGWLSRSHPRLMSCPKGKFWDAFGTLLWTLPGMNLRCPWEKPTRPSLWAGFPTVSVPPPPRPASAAPCDPFPYRLPARRLSSGSALGGSRLQEAPTLHQTLTSLLTLNFDGSAIARWRSSVLPSGPCNKNRLGRGWVARIAENYFQLFAWLEEATGHAVLVQSQSVFGSITWRPDIRGREL